MQVAMVYVAYTVTQVFAGLVMKLKYVIYWNNLLAPWSSDIFQGIKNFEVSIDEIVRKLWLFWSQSIFLSSMWRQQTINFNIKRVFSERL